MFGYTPDQRKNLETFDLDYVAWYDGRRRVNRVRGSTRSRKYATADLLDAMDMIELLLVRHQSYYERDDKYQWRLWFPYLFVKPKVGGKIINQTSLEEYEILYVEEIQTNQARRQHGKIVRPAQRQSFTGLIILKEGNRAPQRGDKLLFKDDDMYIDFFEWGPRKHVSSPGPVNSDSSEQLSGPFKPTITWSIKRVEPGTTGKRPFDPQKESKPHIRDIYGDPEHTYLLNTPQEVNALSLRDGYYTTGNPLLTGNSGPLTRAQQDPRLSTRSVIVWGQWFDNLVQFDCWSNQNYEANMLIYWFEDFMDLYSPVLIRNGVQQVLYWQRQQDQTVERWRDDIDNRTVQYYFRTEKLRLEKAPNLMSLDVRVRVARPDEEVLLRGSPTGVTTVTGSFGLHPWDVQYDSLTGFHYTGTFNYLWGTLQIQDGFGI